MSGLLVRLPMTNLVQLIPGLDANPAVIHYRAFEFASDPPLLEAELVRQNRSLLVYGRAGTNYVVQYSTNLSAVVTWYPLLSYTATNSFQHFTNLGGVNPMIFYRVKRP